MITIRKNLAIALTAAALTLGALTATSPASAHGFGGGRGGHGIGGGHGVGGGFGRGGHGHFGYGWGRGHYGYRWGGYHRFGYGFAGYRRFAHVDVVATPRVCPEGTHLGFRGKYCWPNR